MPAPRDSPSPTASSWRLPLSVLRPSVLLACVLLVPLVAAFLLAGGGAALLVGLAYGSAVPLAVGLPTGRGVALCVPAAMVAVIAAAIGPTPLPAACLVALVVLVAIPGSPLGGTALVGIPTTAAVLVALPIRLDPVQVGLWTLLGGVAVVLLVGLLRRGRTASRFGSPAAPRIVHAVVSAVAVGLVVWVVLAFDVPHGYWAAMTLTLVLRRARDDTASTARRRVLGTVLGAVVALVLAPYLPAWASVVLLAVLLVGVLGYALVGNYTLQVACLTPLVVLLGSSPGGTAQLATERVLATTVGAVAAGVVGALVLWLERRLGVEDAESAASVPPDVAG